MRARRIIAAFLTCALLESCGGFYFVGFVSNPGGTTSVAGIVSVVKSGFVSDPTGVITPFTAVTFTNAGTVMTVKFCGDQKQWFPINQRVRAEYIAGVFCNLLQNVVVAKAGDSTVGFESICRDPHRPASTGTLSFLSVAIGPWPAR